VIKVAGRMYAVKVRYHPPKADSPPSPGATGDWTYVEQAVAVVDEICHGRNLKNLWKSWGTGKKTCIDL